MIDWKVISARVSMLHRQRGFAVVPLGGPGLGEAMVNIVPDVLIVKGRELRPKLDVRRWLFKHRHLCAFRRKDGFYLWSVYEQGHSLMGVAVLLPVARAFRFQRRNPDVYTVQELEQRVVA